MGVLVCLVGVVCPLYTVYKWFSDTIIYTVRPYKGMTATTTHQEGDLRVWYINNPPNRPTLHPVRDIEAALTTYEELLREDKGEYHPAIGLEVFENGQWCEWYDDNGDDIQDVLRNEDSARENP